MRRFSLRRKRQKTSMLFGRLSPKTIGTLPTEWKWKLSLPVAGWRNIPEWELSGRTSRRCVSGTGGTYSRVIFFRLNVPQSTT